MDHSAEKAEKIKTDSVQTIGNRTSRDELRRSAATDHSAGARASGTGKTDGTREAGSSADTGERRPTARQSATTTTGLQAKKTVAGEPKKRIIRRIRMADGRIVEQVVSADAADIPGKTAGSPEADLPQKQSASGAPQGRIIRRIRTADGRIIEQVVSADAADIPGKTAGSPEADLPQKQAVSGAPQGRIIRRIRTADGRIIEQVVSADAADIPGKTAGSPEADPPQKQSASGAPQGRIIRRIRTADGRIVEQVVTADAVDIPGKAAGSPEADPPQKQSASGTPQGRIIRRIRTADGRVIEQVVPADAADIPGKTTGRTTTAEQPEKTLTAENQKKRTVRETGTTDRPEERTAAGAYRRKPAETRSATEMRSGSSAENPASGAPQGKSVRRIRTADGQIVEKTIPAQTAERSGSNRAQGGDTGSVRSIAAMRTAEQKVPASGAADQKKTGHRQMPSGKSAAAVQPTRPKSLDRRRRPEGAESDMPSPVSTGSKSEPDPEKNKKRKKLLKILLFLLIILVLLGLFVHSRISHMGDPYDSNNTEKVSVDIPEGSTTSTIAETLQMRGLIGSETSFKLLTRMEGRDGDFKAGTYMLSPSMSMDEIMDELEKGYNTADTVRFTVPEGSTLNDIAGIVAKTKACTEEEFLEEAAEGDFANYKFLADVPDGDNKLEGFLYPDTYDIYTNEKPHDIICRMLDQFENVINKVESKSTPSGQAKKYSLYERVTIASMIESECRVDDERAKIASVIYNRLDDGMKLQIDATVQYALGEHTNRVTYSDLEVDSPYNTYKVTGLPAGPICSPAQASLKAANQPEETDYMYYVLKSASSVNHNFAVTGSEFEQYRKAYLSTMK